MGILVKKVRVTNYKSIFSQLFILNDCGVFFGKNNTGKTNILKSIYLGLTYDSINPEDVYNSKTDPFSPDKKVVIDIFIEPHDEKGRTKSFDEDWELVFGGEYSIDVNGDSYFAFRTELSFDEKRSTYTNSKKRIKNWKDDGTSLCAPNFNSRVFDYIQCVYINAHRDINEDLKDRKSFWHKLVSKIKISEEHKKDILCKLRDINSTIKNESELIQKIEQELKKTVADENYDISISPVTKDIETLYKGMDIYYSNDDFNPVPVSNLGSGIRSWAVLSTVKSQMNLASLAIQPFHSVLLIEEPEAHVHPQAQMHLVEIIRQIKSQKLIATHSPYVINRFDIETLVRIDKDKNGTTIFPFSDSKMGAEDCKDINRTCLLNKGDLVFANCIIFVEGITEILAMPKYFQYYFGKTPSELGVTFVSADGGGRYEPFLKLSEALHLNWLLFSDGEVSVLNSLRNSLRKIFNNPTLDVKDEKRILVIPNNHYYEKYLFYNGYRSQIYKVIDRYNKKHSYIQREYISSTDWVQHKNPRRKPPLMFASAQAEIEECTMFYLKRNKIGFAEAMANEIVANCARKNDLPIIIWNLLRKIEKEIKFNG